jgi:hypothetical protein
VLCAVQIETIGYVVVWQHILGVTCVLCAVCTADSYSNIHLKIILLFSCVSKNILIVVSILEINFLRRKARN